MDSKHSREDRWFAFLLGDLPAHERAAVEAEMAAAPEEAALVRRAFEEARDWAAERAEAGPFDAGALYEPAMSHARPRPAWRLPLALAASAMLVFALAQVQFTVSFGDTTLAWGVPAAERPVTQTAPSETALASLGDRLEILESNQKEALGLIETVARKTVALEDHVETATADLADYMRLESETRMRDMLQLIEYSGASPFVVGSAQQYGAENGLER